MSTVDLKRPERTKVVPERLRALENYLQSPFLRTSESCKKIFFFFFQKRRNKKIQL